MSLSAIWIAGGQHVLLRFLAVLGALVLLAGRTEAQGIWIPAGSLHVEQRDHSATLLSDGRVLIIGPYSIELYDPANGTFRVLTGAGWVNPDGRPVRLQDGKVLVVGGNTRPSSAVLFDPLTETFIPTGSLNEGRVGPTVTRLPDGRVLVVGGLDASRTAALASVELFDPTTGLFTFTGSLQTARFAHTAALLLDGTVLVAGGEYIITPGFAGTLSSAELFDPTTGTFGPTGSLTVPRCCMGWTETQVLDNGKALVLGGFAGNAAGDLYDPTTRTFSATGNLNILRGVPSATRLPDGRVLVAGGNITVKGLAHGTPTAETYDPATNAFTLVASMNQMRQQHTATALSNGQVLVTGGYDWSTGSDVRSAELYFMMTVDIDVIPGGFPNNVNPGSKAKLPVALLATPTFDASTVDPSTVRFGSVGTESAPARWSLGDVDGDGDEDLILHFNIQGARIVCGTTSVSLTGITFDRRTIHGSDSIETVGCPHEDAVVTLADGLTAEEATRGPIAPRRMAAGEGYAAEIPPGSVTAATAKVPLAFEIGARPNPGLRGSSILYTLPHEGHVKVRVFDVSGREVARLVDSLVPAGRHVVPFRADTPQLYLYRVEWEGKSLTGRLTILR